MNFEVKDTSEHGKGKTTTGGMVIDIVTAASSLEYKVSDLGSSVCPKNSI